MIELRPVDKNNIDDVLALEVHEHQKRFVSTVAESLAQAYVYKDNAYPFAVYSGDEIVGFIMMGYYEVKHYYTLWKFLIDKKHQHKGYGRQALALGIKYLKDKFDVDSVYTGVVPGNAVASRLYRSVGFVSTGLIELGMEELRLECK
ncbi:GNAT family N-acetyltransferase [uncultured Ruminococcus sp.]|uniref:GNAT family N-acetyltransferase n=1 Tax=uncultured Ruminococcus sp. TaxID=165186 RepID=UPI0025F633CE|nr:GNAT family N-acetyltransferase [uncultured Ruminococcus sp.]